MNRKPLPWILKQLSYIKVQIAAYYLLASLLLAGLLGVVLYYSIAGIFLDQTLRYTSIAIERSGRYLEIYIDRLKTVSEMIATNPSTIRYMDNSEILPGADRADLTALMDAALGSDPYLASLIAVSKDGRIVSNEEALDMTVSRDMMEQDWYVAALSGSNMPVLTSARMQEFSMDKDTWVISVSREIVDRQGRNVGVLRADVDYAVVEGLLEDLDLGSQGYPFILNDSNEIVYYSDPAAEGENLAALRDMPSGYHPESNLMNGSYRLENADWTLVGVASLESLTALRRQLLEILVLVSVVLVAVSLGGGLVIAGRITRPIRRLEETMASVGADMDAVAAADAGSHEIRSLASRFNAMMVKMRALMKEVEEKEKYLRTSEITALYNQINPHFLYNTLDTIVWMAEFGDSKKVIETTQSLAAFFRLSLSKGDPLVTLEEEAAHVERYLFIQKQRYQDKLDYVVDMEPAVLGCRVPKIILQPLAENALYHGIREKEGPGRIRIAGRAAGGFLELVVEDDGVGMDPQWKKTGNLGTRVGIGMDNVDKRIRLHYGEGYGLKVESPPDGMTQGTRVVLRLAMDSKGGESHGEDENDSKQPGKPS